MPHYNIKVLELHYTWNLHNVGTDYIIIHNILVFVKLLITMYNNILSIMFIMCIMCIICVCVLFLTNLA